MIRVRGFARRALTGRLLSVNVGLLPLRRRPSGGGVCRSLSRPLGGGGGAAGAPACDSYLVDPASSHMLVSKTKPCMSKYKRFYTVKLRMAH